MRIVQNNFCLWCQHKTTQFRLENENSEPQMWDKDGHVVISAVCRKRQLRDFASRLRETANVTLSFHVSRKIA